MVARYVWVNHLIIAIFALVLGILGLSFVFSDLSRGESSVTRFTITSLYFFFCGFGIGFFQSKNWYYSGLTALWSVLFGGVLVFFAILKKGSKVFVTPDPPYISAGLIILILPLGLSLLGGYLGSVVAQKREG